jgi:phenylalanyl-tRNA synthetase beta chain
MRVSLSWVRDHVALTQPPEEVAHRLTMAGLETEKIERIGDATGVVVAEVLAKQPHPNADTLTIVTVTDGRERAEVVCGAPNVPPVGGKVAWAKPGARLPKFGVLEPKKIRGVMSPGMLCAEDELGLSEDHAGIIHLPTNAEVGSDALVDLRDTVLELNVTTNRPDCLGHIGIARELAALFGLPLRKPQATASDSRLEPAPVAVEDVAACPRYVARIIEGVTIGPSPKGVQRRLRAVGVRPISNVVDATNYVLLEWGQPLHAFDLDKLAGERLTVRRARAGETLRTLDGVERKLEPSDLVIADGKRAVALAGIMGGADAEVSESTRRVLLESAYFDPATIRRTAKRLGLHTEASHRFERGTDINDGVARASAQCASLLCEWAGGKARAGKSDFYPKPVEPKPVRMRPAYARRLLGIELPTAEISQLLRAIELPATAQGEELHVVVPTFRPDLAREVDLIEELARLHGFDRFPATLPLTEHAPAASGDPVVESTRDVLASLGLCEIVSYGFTSPDRIAALGFSAGDPRGAPLRIKNPLREDTAVLRTSLLPGLLGALRTNLDRGAQRVALFEVGTVFLTRGGTQPLPDERRTAAILLAGDRPRWLCAEQAQCDFFDLKGLGERLFERLGVDKVAWHQRADLPLFHPGVAAEIGRVGFAGEVHPRIRDAFGIETACFYLELDLERVPTPGPVQAAQLPRFPAIERDISCFIASEVPASAIELAIREPGDPLLVGVRLVEDYRDPSHVTAGQKSMLWSLTYRSAERTLTDDEVQAAHGRIVAGLVERLGIRPR